MPIHTIICNIKMLELAHCKPLIRDVSYQLLLESDLQNIGYRIRGVMYQNKQINLSSNISYRIILQPVSN